MHGDTRGKGPATNVLLINSNISRSARSGYGSTPPPAGLISLAGVLRQRGHRVKICQVRGHVPRQDEEALPIASAELEGLLGDFPADVVGISARNVGAARQPANPFHLVEYYSAFYDARLVRALRRLTKAPVVMGGSAVSLEPGLYQKVVEPNYALAGEAEETLPALLDALAAGAEPRGIAGLLRRGDDAALVAETWGKVADLATIGIGACDLVEDFHEHYYANGGFAPIQTKRGCAYNCVYCTTPRLEGQGYRYRPMGQVVEEMRAYHSAWGVKHFFFTDSTFNHPVERGLEICDAILASGLPVKWFTEVTPACVTDELCRQMRRAGCIGVTLGLDSCTDSVLATYRKPFRTAEIRHAIGLLRAHGLPFDATVILGGPGDTPQTLEQTVAFCSEHLSDNVVRFFDGMIVTTGTPVHEIACREGLIDPAVPYESLVLSSDFRKVRNYDYFFPHAPEGRRAMSERVTAMCRRDCWLTTGADYPPDPETGELTLHPDIVLERGARPWWSGLHRRKTVQEVQGATARSSAP